MTPNSNGQPDIIRTERGLTIAGTRTSIYDVIDLLNAHYPPKLIRDTFNLTDAQINAALSYIDANQVQIEAEKIATVNISPGLQRCHVNLDRRLFGQNLKNRKRDEVLHNSNDFPG